MSREVAAGTAPFCRLDEIAAIRALWPRALYDPENAVPGLSLSVTG